MRARRDFLKGAAVLSASAVFRRKAQAARAAGKPNVIFVFADQHRASCLGCYGNKDIRTPNFDRFASEGLVMENCMSPTPVCVPMRVANVTGKLGCRTKVVVNVSKYLDYEKHFTVARAFKAAGYRCGYVGKWHMGDTDSAPGDPRRLGFDDYWRIKKSHAVFKWPVDTGTDGVIKQTGFSPESMVDFGLEFIKQNKNDPFCLYLSWGPPHTPYTPPEEYDHYQDATIPPNVPREGKAWEHAKKSLPKYMGLVEGLDVAFGRLMGELDKMGLAENTIVVYTSDHGDMLGSQRCEKKRWPYEESAHIPFLIRWPGKIPAGRREEMPLSVIDFYPTLAGLAGVKAADDVQGGNFSDVMLGKPGAKKQEAVYLTMYHMDIVWPGWRAIRTAQYSYARTKDEKWFLYDIRKDPYQLNNLLKKEPALVKKFDAMLAKKMAEYGDGWDIGEEYVGSELNSKKWVGQAHNMGCQFPGSFYNEDGTLKPGAKLPEKGKGKKKKGKKKKKKT